ncbi:MAG: hypothetical protein ACI90V_007214 [Bacillariaceae sp.]|jgi:hypothetical protein
MHVCVVKTWLPFWLSLQNYPALILLKISSVSRGKIDIKRILKEKIESPKINVMIGSGVVSDNYCTSHLTTNNEVALLFDTYVD